MKLASIIHHGLQPPLKLDAGLLRIHPISPSIQFPKWVKSQFTHSHNPLLFSAGCRYRWTRHLLTVSSKGIEQEEGSFTSEEETSGSQSRDDNNKTQSNHMIDSVDSLGARTKGPENYKSSVRTVALCVFTAVTFGVGLGLKNGLNRASEFFAGYLLEQSLSVDNLFVFVLIFKYFKVPIMYQNRVLSYGVVGAIVFRLSLILLGTATLQRFEAVNLLLAGILLYSSFKLFTAEEESSDLADNYIVRTCQKIIPVTSTYDEDRFFTIVDGVWKATPLLLVVAVIELSDIAFAVDSIPAVFGVTRDPFIVFTSNLFAILGLRSLYTLISESMGDLEYLQPSIGIVLGFIGFKMVLDYFGYHISTEVSLGCVATTLTTGVLLSLMKKSDKLK